jgi:two-component system cell cycle sensor histidine kinase/response regulator CckA
LVLNARGLKRALWIVAPAGIAVSFAFWFFAVRTPPAPQRTLRIGFEVVPPVQIRTEGGFAGVAVETVNEAARRAGVSLQWVETGTSSDEAFRRGLVDLWPIMADLPYRRKTIHITKPWLHTNHSLVLPAGSPTPDRSFSGRIALHKMPVHVKLLQEQFPGVQLIEFADILDIVKEVCTGRASAGFMEDRVAVAVLRDRPAECTSVPLRAEVLPGMTLQLGIASTFEAAGAADKLRGEIGNLFRNGTLAATMAKYSYYGLDDTWATYDLLEAAERDRWMAWGIAVLGIALAVTGGLAASLRQRKRSEAAIRASEERFRAIFQQAGMGAAQVTLEGNATIVNDRYCEVLGYTREDLLGRSLLDRVHADDRAAVLANRQRLLDGETPPYSIEVRFVRKDGDVTWVRLHESLVRTGDGRPVCSIAMVEDITERRQTEAALQESERRFRNMADTSPVMIWVAGPDKLCTFFNQEWLAFTGASMEQAVGYGWSTSVHPDDRERCFTTYSSAFDTRARYQTECRMRRADGAYRWVLATGVPRFETGDTFAGYVGSCTDITDMKRAQQETLNRQKLESLGVLAGGIAHDFNNLLGSILTTSELVLSDLPPGSQLHDEIEAIAKVADRAAGIVRQMMTYAGQESPTLEPLDLSLLVKEMLQFLKVSISKRALLTVDLPENLPAIRANAAQIRQVAMNLITNASESLGDREGLIFVRVEHVEPGRDSALPIEHLRLVVSDTGCGMTEDIQSNIFDPFFTTKFAGRGLGLAAVQGIVRAHGGAINVVSTPGQGSRFEILLPCSGQVVKAGGDVPKSTSGVDGGAAEATILVVEDEQDLRVAVSKMLRKQNFSVIEAADGRGALDLFQTHQANIDVVLLDLTLPGMTGAEVLKELRRMRPHVEVVVTTAYSKDSAQMAMDEGQPWLFIRKPYHLSELTGLLRIACGRAKSSRQENESLPGRPAS